MPVHRTSKPTCFQWGSHGATYCGRGAASKAAAQGRAAYAHGYQGKGHTRRTEIEHPDLIRLWDTRDLREGDDIPGIGVVHDRAIITYHVTDDPSRPSSALRKRANLLQAYGPKGAHAELGRACTSPACRPTGSRAHAASGPSCNPSPRTSCSA